MGNIFTRLTTPFKLLSAAISELKDISEQYGNLLARINARTHLPSVNSTYSYWFRDPPFPELVNAQSAVLPAEADIVIIGSGITGASIARTLLLEDPDAGSKRIVMLEAREVCSGATGRNGGHIKPEPHGEYVKLRDRFGKQAAQKISDFRMRSVDILVGLAEAEGFEAAECRKVKTGDLFYDAVEFKKTVKALELFRQERPGVAPELELLDADRARKEWAGGEHCVGAITWDAGAVWPYRLVTSLLSSLLEEHPKSFTLETGTPVIGISVCSPTKRPYLVHTPRGHISATHVIHATNGYSSHLIPGMHGKIFPVRGQMSAQRPGQSFPDPHGTRSWCFRFNGGYDYITQRPTGELMTGGGLFINSEDGMREIGVDNDDETRFLAAAHLNGTLPAAFGKQNWGEDAAGGRLIDMWTGILGISADALPWVGRLDAAMTQRRLPGSKPTARRDFVVPGEWISAGYTGEGMVNAWLCGVACAIMVLGRENIHADEAPGRPRGPLSTWFPDELRLSKKRLGKANAVDLFKLL